MNEKNQPLDWILGEDLSSLITASKQNWIKKCRAADQFANEGPWRRLQDDPLRTYVILLWLQNREFRPALRRQAELTRELHEVVRRLKAALQDEILHGVKLSLYTEAWGSEEAETVKQLQATIESKRAEWRAKCEIEAKEKQKQRMRRDAEILRERVQGFREKVNWFAPMPIYNHIAHNDQAPWGYCQATGQDRKKVSAFVNGENQKAIDYLRHKGAGRRLPLYGFETNLQVLDKWLGGWLLTSPDPGWFYHDSSKPGKTLCEPKPERVCWGLLLKSAQCQKRSATNSSCGRFGSSCVPAQNSTSSKSWDLSENI